MKAQVLTGRCELDYRDRPLSAPAPDEAVVRVEYCGICGTDVHCYRTGLMVPLGTVLGHEITGVISEIGTSVGAFRAGDRVVINPIPRCGRCYWCERGQFVLCAEGLKEEIGLSGGNDGGFAEYVRVKHPDVMLHHLPDEVSFEQGALVEPLATSLHAVRQSRLRPGDSAVVFGAGMIGLGVLEFLRISGAGSVFAIEPASKKRALSLRLGVDAAFPPAASPDDCARRIAALTDGIGPDIVFECSGTPAAFDHSLRCVRKGGQVILVGISEQALSFKPLEPVLKEIEIKAILGYYDEFERVIGFLNKGVVRTDPLISATLPLADLERGIRDVSSNPDIVKMLVHP